MNQNITEENYWAFSKLPFYEEFNFNKILERFYGLGVVGLTRENIQNSLDGRLKGSDTPVVVRINLGEVDTKEIPGMDTIAEHIQSLVGKNSYTKETIEHMKASLDKERVKYISFEDSNTKGLTGAKYGQSESKEHTWGIYAYNKGVHFEEENEEFEASRGGSHGVGKIASNAASDLHLMYFANCDEAGEQHLGGTIQLIEHKLNNNYYRSTGYFAKTEEQGNSPKFMPHENKFSSIFEKNNRGLKIVIPFLRDSFDDELEVVKAVCDNFFISILEKKLVVHINDLVVNAETITAVVKDAKYYTQEIEDMKKVFTPLYVDTYSHTQPRQIVIDNGKKVFHFNLYFTYDENIPKGRVGIIRTIGMKIEDFTVKSNSTKPFNAVLIGGLEEDSYLKSLENESHTKISKDDIKDPKLQREASKFIRELNAEIVKVIDEEMRKHNPVDGKINTKDLLYTMKIDFKENLARKLGTVSIKNGKNLVTVTDEPNKKKKVKEKRDNSTGDKKTGNNKKPENERKKLKKVQKSEKERLVDNREDQFKINPFQVERLIIRDQEIIQINLSGSEELANVTDCDLKLTIIDGMGKEYPNEMNIENSYKSIVDINNGNKQCVVTNGVIKNIKFIDGIINLKFELTETYNRSLKFIYSVEV